MVQKFKIGYSKIQYLPVLDPKRLFLSNLINLWKIYLHIEKASRRTSFENIY